MTIYLVVLAVWTMTALAIWMTKLNRRFSWVAPAWYLGLFLILLAEIRAVPHFGDLGVYETIIFSLSAVLAAMWLAAEVFRKQPKQDRSRDNGNPGT